MLRTCSVTLTGVPPERLRRTTTLAGTPGTLCSPCMRPATRPTGSPWSQSRPKCHPQKRAVAPPKTRSTRNTSVMSMHHARETKRGSRGGAMVLLGVRLQQERRQRGQQEERAQHVQEEHEGEQDAHVGLELERRHGPGRHADRS